LVAAMAVSAMTVSPEGHLRGTCKYTLRYPRCPKPRTYGGGRNYPVSRCFKRLFRCVWTSMEREWCPEERAAHPRLTGRPIQRRRASARRLTIRRRSRRQQGGALRAEPVSVGEPAGLDQAPDSGVSFASKAHDAKPLLQGRQHAGPRHAIVTARPRPARRGSVARAQHRAIESGRAATSRARRRTLASHVPAPKNPHRTGRKWVCPKTGNV
jgi:hypothetical protein